MARAGDPSAGPGGKAAKGGRKAAERERLRDQRAALAAERAALAQERSALERARRAMAADLSRAEALRAEYAAHEPVTAEPVPDVAPAPMPQPLAAPAEPSLPVLSDVRGGPAGAQLCFAEPVFSGDRAVVPVARVRTFAGAIDARPVGVLEVGPDGVRLERLAERAPDLPGRIAAAAAGLVTGAMLALGARRRSRRGRPRPSRR